MMNDKSKHMIEIVKDIEANIHKTPRSDQQDFRNKVLHLSKSLLFFQDIFRIFFLDSTSGSNMVQKILKIFSNLKINLKNQMSLKTFKNVNCFQIY